MNSLSEPLQAASYPPMEYHEAGDPFDLGSITDASDKQMPVSTPPEPQSEPAALIAAQLEVERRAITAQAKQEAECEIQRGRSEIVRAIEEFEKQRDEYFRQCETEVVDLALAISRRIIHRETQIDPRLLAGLVNYELDQLDAATSVRLIVSPDSLRFWSEAVPAMSRAVEVATEKSLVLGDVRIETVLGSTTVSFERELKEIERGFFDLLSHRQAVTESKPVRVQ